MMMESIGPLMNVKEASKFIGIGENYLYKLAKWRQIPHIRIGRTVRFSKMLIHDLINKDEETRRRFHGQEF